MYVFLSSIDVSDQDLLAPTLLFVLFALRVASSSVNAFLKIDVVLAKRS